MSVDYDNVTASEWAKGIGFSIIASIVGGASKLAIRKSWLMIEGIPESHPGRYPITTEMTTADDDGIQLPNPLEYSHEKQEENHHRKIHFIAISLRMIGMIGMTFINPFFCILAMNYASPSVLAPFSGLTLVWVILLSEFLIGEKPQKKQIAAAALIILGEVIVAFYGDHTSDDGITIQDVIQSYQQVSFQLYFIGLILWMYVVYTLIQHSSPSQIVRKRLGWGLAGGSVNGLQNFLKDSLTILKASHHSKNTSTPFPTSLFSLFLILAAASAFAGLILLTACMKRYDALFSSAMFVGSFVISASIMSAIHYHTFQHLNSAVDGLFYCVGLFLLMVGVYLLVEDSFDKEAYDSSIDDSDHHVHDKTISSTSYRPLSQSTSFTKPEINEPLVREIT